MQATSAIWSVQIVTSQLLFENDDDDDDHDDDDDDDDDAYSDDDDVCFMCAMNIYLFFSSLDIRL